MLVYYIQVWHSSLPDAPTLKTLFNIVDARLNIFFTLMSVLHYTDGDFWRMGTSRNVPIAGFEMILREDYKSRDEVEGLIFFPKYHFKPQDTGNIP